MSVNPQDFEKKGYERSVFKVTESANYCCQWCGNGAETFEKAFPKGCARCGAPAGKFDREIVIRTFPDIDKSFFVVNANDTKQETAKFIGILKQAGGKVVTLEDILPNGVATNEVAGILQTAAMRAPWVVFVPSPQLEKGPTNDFILNVVMGDMLRNGTRKTFPLFVDEKHISYAPPILAGVWGVVMNKEGGETSSGLEMFQKRLPEMIGKMQEANE